MSSEPGTAGRAELLDIASGLLAGWYATAAVDTTVELGQRGERPNVSRFISVVALAGHTHLAVDQAIQHFEDGQDLLGTPMLRLGFESALTASWMALNSESSFALHNNEISAREALRKTIGESKQFADRLKDFPDLDDKLENVSSDAQAKYFWRLCEDLAPDGKTLYLLYRMLSKMCHPSGFVIDRFVRMDEEGEVTALGWRPLPHDEDPGLMYFLAVMSLVYAGRAVDFIEPSRSRRSELRDAARAAGFPAELRLTPEADQRIAKAEQKRRRAGWRRPSGKRAGANPN